MPEAYAWPEGNVYFSTGVPFATSGLFAFCEQTTTNRQWGLVNTVAANGIYFNHSTGQRIDVNIQAVYSFDKTAERIAEAQTAVHLKFLYNNVNGSAGLYLFSGRIQSWQTVGQNGQMYKYTMTYYANNWSAF